MPFTISHAAAALPVHALGKSRLPLAALMVGSMAPDFAFFVPWGVSRHDTHTLAGLFTLCLPLGLLVWLYYVRLLERPTLAFLPDAWRTRVRPSGELNLRNVLLAAVAVLAGSMTHLAWDAFTHSTPLADTLPALRDNLLGTQGAYLPVYFVLQVLSSVFGLVVLAVWAWRIRSRPELPPHECVAGLTPRVSHDERYLAVLFIAASAVVIGLLNVSREGGYPSLFHLLVGMMAGAGVGWSALAAGVRFRSRTLRLFAQPDAD